MRANILFRFERLFPKLHFHWTYDNERVLLLRVKLQGKKLRINIIYGEMIG